ncbi:DUF3817 domain-containing protein [Leucobacter sp. UT-8R-CII-1-4]|uniref:DUF3817 domain-containing protein n=1 Tax=Leucobacter sp. UT-8R-CII-1-4 TaxID=3040075 RepID=UPI0024A96168|nr:DUF3817 domain-containing protein [Leucobacter sp. UT-8R-CII-1-4]MDI6023259.1 DUF3817 domain-containing protein [Leucobacter sp. UT-8R-CII-1-4]
MVLQPRPADYPRIRKALSFYKIASIITGVMLLLLLAEMILKYSPTHIELFADGGLSFAPVVVGEGCQWYSLFNPFQEVCEMSSTGTGTNLSLLILMIHGWFYVVYLVACFMVWSPMRWPFSRFLKLALGGVVPLLSFFMEVQVAREVTAFLEKHDVDQPEAEPQGSNA